jgi:hypothetical protein
MIGSMVDHLNNTCHLAKERAHSDVWPAFQPSARNGSGAGNTPITVRPYCPGNRSKLKRSVYAVPLSQLELFGRKFP